MGPAVAELSETLQNIAKNLPAAFEQLDFSGLLFSFKNLGFEIDQIFEGVDLDTPEGLAKAIQFVVDSFAALTNVVSGIVDAWGPVVSGFVAGADAFNSLDAGSQKATGTLLGIAQIFRDLHGAVTSGADALETIGSAMQALAGIQALSAIKDFAAGVGLAGTASTTASTGVALLSGALRALPLVGLAFLANDAAAALASGEKSSLAGAVDWLVNSLTGSDDLADFVYDLDLMGEGSKEAALKALELEVSVQKLRNATGDASITVDNYYQKLAEFADTTAEAAEAHKKLGANIDLSKTDFTNLNDVISLSQRIAGDWGTRVAASTTQLLEFSGVIGDASGKMITLNGGAGLSTEEFEKFASQTEELNKAMDRTGDAAGSAEKGFKTLAEAEEYLYYHAERNNAKFIEFKDGLWQITDGGFAAADATNKLADATNKSAEAAKTGSEEWKRAQDVLIESQRRADEFAVAMGKLSNERYEIQVKAAVDLRTAEIEASTQRISAAFQATSEVIASLTTGVTDLWGTFAQNNLGPGKSIKLEEAAGRMEDRLDAELELKRQMTDAVVAQATATTQRLSSGEPLISIDAGSLAPELELVFDKILKFTQIKATQEGLSLLVGL